MIGTRKGTILLWSIPVLSFVNAIVYPIGLVEAITFIVAVLSFCVSACGTLIGIMDYKERKDDSVRLPYYNLYPLLARQVEYNQLAALINEKKLARSTCEEIEELLMDIPDSDYRVPVLAAERDALKRLEDMRIDDIKRMKEDMMQAGIQRKYKELVK